MVVAFCALMHRALLHSAALVTSVGCGPVASRPDASTEDVAAPQRDGEAPDGAASEASVEPMVDAGSRCPAEATPMPFVAAMGARHPMDEVLRINHLQAKATHNSYHLKPAADLVEWDYSHAPLGDQLATQGVRGVELDVHWNARCNRFEVYHAAAVDDRTTCRVFTDCLAALRRFSAANPGHHPIFVHIEPKDPPGLFDEPRLVALEREILSVFDRGWLVTPDEVRGTAATVREAVTTRGWPTLAASRGRFLFYMDDSGAPRSVYTHGGRDLAGRLMFVDSDPSDPFAGVVILNDPIANAAEIAAALSAGFLVRTRADSDPSVARSNDRTQLTRALASGAQIVSTDFPARVAGSEYFVEISSGTPSRCSPVTAPMGCTSAMIEDPARIAR
jgi:hypothetical protein